MKLMSLLAAFVALLGLTVAVPVSAQTSKGEEPKTEDPKKEEPKKEKNEDYEALFKDVDKVVTENFVEADVKAFKDNWVAVTKVLNADAKFRELKDKNLKECFDYAVTVDAYKKWATENKVSCEVFLRKGMRILLQHVKLMVTGQIKLGRAWIASQRTATEKKKDSMGEKDYADAIAKLDAQAKTMDNAENGFKLLSDPTDAEKKLLEAESDAIDEVMNEAMKAENASKDAKSPEGTKGN